MLKISVLRERAALEALAPEWEALAAAAAEPSPAYEPWMLLPALEAFGAGQDIRIVTVRRDGQLVGLFPLRLERRWKGLLPALSSWTHPHCVLCVPLVHAGRVRDVLKAVLEWANSESSILELPWLPAEGAVHQALVDVLHGEPRGVLAVEAFTRPLLLRAADADAYIASCMPSAERREMRRQEKRLAEKGRLERRVLRTREELPEWVDEFLALEASGWKGRRGTAFACTEHQRKFARAAFTGAFERGRLIMVGIDLDARPIARFCAFTAGRGAIAFKTAFDEDLRNYGPGTLAVRGMIEAFHERPELEWMDSYTGPNNRSLAGLWKHRRTVLRVAIAADARGEAALALQPLARLAKRLAAKLRRGKRQARTIPSLRPA